MNTLYELEKVYLYSEDLPDLDAFNSLKPSIREVVQDVVVGSYVTALQKGEVQKAISYSASTEMKPFDRYCHAIKTYLGSSLPENQHILLCVGISCLQLFVQNNFTGPFLGPDVETVLTAVYSSEVTHASDQQSIISYLQCDTEGIYNLVKVPEYLFLAKIILFHFKDELISCATVQWWCCRCLYLIQRISDERSPQLHASLNHCLKSMEASEFISQGKFSKELRALFYMENVHSSLYYYEVGKAAEFLKKASEILEVAITQTGCLGKRTKWQSRAIPQLVVKVEYIGKCLKNEEDLGNAHLAMDLPNDVVLNDDARLNKIKFDDIDDDVIPNLRPLEQILLLLTLIYKQRSQGYDTILDEESKAYLVALLQYPKCWSLHVSALFQRSLIEFTQTRSMQRSLQQVEELVSAVTKDNPSRFERSKLFYASAVLPYWELKHELGRMLFKLGCTRSALDIFEELNLWEDMVICYNELHMTNHSERVIREQLSKGETPKLWCLLGDATDDIQFYHKAWELSNYRSSRAMRSLGNYYFSRKDYATALVHFEKSVEINSLQLELWERIAYCSMQLEDWNKCAVAYQKCCILEPDSFECWNNISQAYLKLGQKYRAWKALEEALRCRTNSWHLWDNYMMVSLSLCYYSQALHAYQQILTLKEKHVDTNILGRLVWAILREDVDANGKSLEGLYKTTCDLVGKLTREVPTNPELWTLYGELLSSDYYPQSNQEIKHQAMQCFRKSLAADSQRHGWEKKTGRVIVVLDRALRLLTAVSVTFEGVQPKTALPDLCSICMSVSSVIALAKKGQANVGTDAVSPDVVQSLSAVDKALQQLKDKIALLKELVR